MQNLKILISSLAFFLVSSSLWAQTVIGTWKTIDDNTGKARSLVKIYKEKDQLFGKIIELVDPEEPNPLCDQCKDERNNQPILGLQIIRNLVKVGDAYGKGKILDPENGKEYRCKIWIDPETPNQLNVRGYIAFLYRTQVWHRVQ